MNLRSRIRASFMGTACALTLCAVTIVPTAVLTGCTASERQTAAQLTTTLTQAVANVAQLEGNSTLATKLVTDGAAAAKALENWQQTSSGADIAIQLITILEDDLNLIPGTGPYAQLIDIALAAAQMLISLIPPSAVTVNAAAKLKAHRVRQVNLGHPAPRNSKEFTKQWNDVVKAHPELSGAVISSPHHSWWPGSN